MNKLSRKISCLKKREAQSYFRDIYFNIQKVKCLLSSCISLTKTKSELDLTKKDMLMGVRGLIQITNIIKIMAEITTTKIPLTGLSCSFESEHLATGRKF